MDAQNNNIRAIITEKADLALDDLAKKFNFQEGDDEAAKRASEGRSSKVTIASHFAQDFAKGILAEKDLVLALQKDLEVSQQVAEQVAKELITTVVPLLEKVSEESLNKPAPEFDGGLEKPAPRSPEDFDIFPKVKPLETASQTMENKAVEPSIQTFRNKPKEKMVAPTKKKTTFKKVVEPEPKIEPEVIEKPAPQTKQPRGPDSYREPIN